MRNQRVRDFYRRKREQNPGWRRDIDKEYNSRPEVKERKRRSAWKKAGIPLPERPEPTNCECCGKAGGTDRQTRLHVDHDHITGKFRGWICRSCNLGLGKFGDNLAGLLNAVEYLKKYGS